MKKGGQFKGLLKELGRDPRLKRIISKRRTRGKGEARVENMSGIVLLILAIAARFATKKKARALDELMDIIYLLVQVSLVLKENVFDRPEVKAFLSHRSKEVYSLAQECIAMVLPKTKGLRPMHTSR
jgi:hypothetical protein